MLRRFGSSFRELRFRPALKADANGLHARLADLVEGIRQDVNARMDRQDQAIDRLAGLVHQLHRDSWNAATQRHERLLSSQLAIEQELENVVGGLGPMADFDAWAHRLADVIDLHLYAVLTDSGVRPWLRFLALAELQRRYDFAEGMAGAEHKVFSQNGEDGVLLELLKRVGVTDRRFFVEFGIGDGSEGNCVLLADVAGWRGLFIEGDELDHGRLAAKYANSDRVTTLCALVTPQNVEELFEAGGVPEEPDVMSIDIDGGDYWVWDAITRYRPRVVIIEHNSAIPADEPLVQPREQGAWDKTDYFGASLAAMEKLGAEKGYRLAHVEMSGLNLFFVRDDLAWPDLEAPLHRSPNYLLVGLRHPKDPLGREYIDPTAPDQQTASVPPEEMLPPPATPRGR